MSTHPIRMTVNGRERILTVSSHETLLDLVRDRLDLRGTNEGCRVGECGACTVWLDGARVPACLVLAPAVDGRHVVTIEGLAAPGESDRLQEAFARRGALQCGFCTPGMIMSAAAMLAETTERPLTEQAVRAGLVGNLCRCTGYAKIVEAVLEVANG